MITTELLANIAAAVAATRSRMSAITDRITVLDGDIERIKNTSPHTEDIIAAKRAELLEVCNAFENRMREQRAAGAPPHTLTSSLSDPAAQAYYMRAQIAAQIPEEVERMFPKAKSGMKAVDRAKALETANKEKAALQEEKEQLYSTIGDVRRIVGF